MISPELLLEAYRRGIFPMAMDDGTIEWFSPDPRAILPLDNFHVPHALRRVLFEHHRRIGRQPADRGNQ